MFILTAFVAMSLPLASRLIDRLQDDFEIEASVTTVLSDGCFVATYMGSDDGAKPGDSVTVFRGQEYVCKGKIMSVTFDTATVRKSGWGSWRTVKTGDRALAYLTLPSIQPPQTLTKDDLQVLTK